MKASLVAYDYGELHRKSELKVVKYVYVRGCPKRPKTQSGSLEILGINSLSQDPTIESPKIKIKFNL
jgi:hypothetical protein